MGKARRPKTLIESLPSTLLYAVRSPMPWMLAALSLLRMLNHLPNLLGLLFELIFWLMAFKIAVEALTNTAHGRYEPLGAGDLSATDGEAVRQIVLQVMYSVSLWTALHFGGLTAVWVGLGLGALFMPAAVILLSMNGSLLHALNPVGWFRLIGRLGVAYFGVVVVAAALTVLSVIAEALLEGAFPADMGMLPASMVALYSLVTTFHVLGDLIHRHHEALELDVSPAVARATYANPVEDDAMEAAANAAADGRPGDAALLLAELFRGRGASDPVHEKFREYALAAGELERLGRHDREYVASLLATGKDKRALAIYVEASTRDPKFAIEHDESMARLVQHAMRGGQTRLGVQLAQDFEARFAQSAFVPEVVHAVAWAMADQFEQADAALLRVQKALRGYPEHPLREKLEALQLQIDKLPKFAAAPPR